MNQPNATVSASNPKRPGAGLKALARALELAVSIAFAVGPITLAALSAVSGA